MKNLALYRKYRPQDFSSVYGQDTITRILKNQIVTDRIGHAYLFSGIRGTGKTTIAKIFAKAVNCESPVDGNPCGTCATCRALNNPANMDIIEIDAASNRGVDEIRELRETITYPPNIGKYKVYIIDETHMLTKEAFNALLKTLEEPPEHAIFLFATTEPAKLPSTILSRCQQFNIKPISDETIMSRLKEVCDQENIKIEDKALEEITKRAGHSMRDALSLLDQCIDLRLPGELITEQDVSDFLGISSVDQITRLATAVIKKEPEEVLDLLNSVREQGKEDSILLEDLIDFFKQFLYFKISGQTSKEYDEAFQSLKDEIESENIYPIIEALIEAHSKLRFNSLSFIITDTVLLSLSSDIIKQTAIPVQTKQERPIRKEPARKTQTVSAPVIESPPLPSFIEEAEYSEPQFSHTESPVKTPEPKTEAIQEKQNENKPKTTSEVDLGLVKRNLIQAAHQQHEGLLSKFFEGAEYRYNKHGLFILIKDEHQFMFHMPEFQDKVQMIVNEVMGHPVKVYPKLKSKFYEHFGKKKPSESTAPSESPSVEDQVKNIIGDSNFTYEVIE